MDAPLQPMSFTRFQGFSRLFNWRYSPAESALLQLERDTVKAYNRCHDLLHRLYVDRTGALPPETGDRLVVLRDRLEAVRDRSYGEREYAQAREALSNISQETTRWWYDLQVRCRRARITRAIAALPARPPTLRDLDESQWWKLYIDSQYHGRAGALRDPGEYFDQDRKESSGYKASMVDSFQRVLLGGAPRELGYAEYSGMHDLVTGGIRDEKHKAKMKKLGGREEFSQFTSPAIPTEDGFARRERLAALAEMREERVAGMPLIVDFVPRTAPEAHPPAVSIHTAERTRAIVDTRYAQAEGPELVNAIFRLYYAGRDARETVDAKLLRIVRTIRSLHVGHFFGDANGRLNMFLLLNRLLQDEGFSPTILPSGPEVFGGLKTLDGLVADVLTGMAKFRAEVDAKRR